MKQIGPHSITHIPGTDMLEPIFEMPHLKDIVFPDDIEHVSLARELKKYKNEEIEAKLNDKPAMYSEVYSPKDELRIFEEHFERALREKKKIHISGITLAQELHIIESYYEELGFMREDINAFEVDFSIPLVTVSCHIENLMWRGSDYKAMREKIFFCPPVRESGQNKALFKGITRGVIAWIDISDMTDTTLEFLCDCVKTEKILPIQMAKVLQFHALDRGLTGQDTHFHIAY